MWSKLKREFKVRCFINEKSAGWILSFPCKITVKQFGFKKSWPGMHWMRLSSISLSLMS